MQYDQRDWQIGQRAKVFSTKAGDIDFGHGGYPDVGQTFTISAIKRVGPLIYLIPDDPAPSGRDSRRCKPVVRVQAMGVPSGLYPHQQATYAELRAKHGPSRYTTGEQVFHAPLPGWGPFSVAGKYEEQGN